jgi:nucleoside-diphosphate-sugar epimerase
MKLLITGATGFLGYRTIEYLLTESDFHIIAAARTKRPERHFKSKRIEYHFGDLGNEDYVKELFVSGPKMIINCASLSSPWGKKYLFIRENIDTQKLLIKYATKEDDIRFIYVSSPSIFVNHRHRINITEKSPLYRPVNAYSWSKKVAENMLKSSGLSYVILRPRALVGRGDTIIFPRLIRAHKNGKLKRMGNGSNICDLTGVKNMAHAIYCSIITKKKEALNEDYNITNDEPVVLWNTIDEVLQSLKYEKVQGEIPITIAYSIARILEKISRIGTQKEPALLIYSVSTLARSMTFDISKAKKYLSYNPIMSTDDAIQEFIQWKKTEY